MTFFKKIRTFFSGLLEQSAVIETSLPPERVLEILRNSLDHRVISLHSPFRDPTYPLRGNVADDGFCVRRIPTAEERMFRGRNTECRVVADGTVEKTEKGSRVHLCMQRYGSFGIFPIFIPIIAAICILGGALRLAFDGGGEGVSVIAIGVVAAAVAFPMDGYAFKRECRKTEEKLRELLEY